MLENTAYRLRNGTGMTVAYFGGSITEGAGSSSYDKCWAGRTTAWLRERWPECEINHVQAAIGGTDSTLGVHRCDRDVCSRHPDLVFYEFSVNDQDLDYETALKNTEACFRKIRTANPQAEIVTVYTATKYLADNLAAGRILHARAAHSTVSHAYGVPEIDIGGALIHRVLADGSPRADADDWLRYTKDVVHPNDDGYAVYFSVMRERLGEWLDGAEALQGLKTYPLPEPIVPDAESHMRARIADCLEAEADSSWTVREESLCGRYPRYMECLEPGGELAFTFEGRQVGVLWMLAKDSGDALCSVDGGEWFRVSSWDIFSKTFSRANSAVIKTGLPEGRHTLRMKVSADKADESEGHALRIGAFLVL
jgi:lysophospholipase L1-like esterase